MEKENTLSEHTNPQEEECSLSQNTHKDAEGAAEIQQKQLMADLRKGLTVRDDHFEVSTKLKMSVRMAE